MTIQPNRPRKGWALACEMMGLKRPNALIGEKF